MTHSKKATAT